MRLKIVLFFFQDCHGPEFDDLAVADDVQNYELISGYQNDTHTTVEFRRQLDTCDKQDFAIGVSYAISLSTRIFNVYIFNCIISITW